MNVEGSEHFSAFSALRSGVACGHAGHVNLIQRRAGFAAGLARKTDKEYERAPE